MKKKLGEMADFQKGYAFKSKDYQNYGTKIVRVTKIFRIIVHYLLTVQKLLNMKNINSEPKMP